MICKLSIFFDILLSCCPGITREQYLNGSFKTNHSVAVNQLAILRQARSTLWQAMHGLELIHVVTVSKEVKHIYMDNETFAHRRLLFDENMAGLANVSQNMFKPYQNSETSKHLNISMTKNSVLNGHGIVVNSSLDTSTLLLDKNVIVVDSRFRSSKLSIGENTYLSDLKLVSKFLFVHFIYKVAKFYLID